jgi:hypothetical protein
MDGADSFGILIGLGIARARIIRVVGSKAGEGSRRGLYIINAAQGLAGKNRGNKRSR